MWKNTASTPELEKPEPNLARPLLTIVLTAIVTLGAVGVAYPSIRDKIYEDGYTSGYAEAEKQSQPENIQVSGENSAQEHTKAEQAGGLTLTKRDGPREIIAYTGQVYNRPKGECVAPLTIETRADAEVDFYIILQKITTGDTYSFYVRGGETAEMLVPLGNYEIFYATGETWYGRLKLFGESTRRYQCEGTFLFEEEDGQYLGWTLELYLQSNGNMDTYEVPTSEFPA